MHPSGHAWLRLGPGTVAPQHLQHAPSGLLGHVANPISSQKNGSVRETNILQKW
tara:strand:- start:582 stop:743 length:162 start_codon:yes stop_codon:yes gene_type:complete